jgi:hypothetical protein
MPSNALTASPPGYQHRSPGARRRRRSRALDVCARNVDLQVAGSAPYSAGRRISKSPRPAGVHSAQQTPPGWARLSPPFCRSSVLTSAVGTYRLWRSAPRAVASASGACRGPESAASGHRSCPTSPPKPRSARSTTPCGKARRAGDIVLIKTLLSTGARVSSISRAAHTGSRRPGAAWPPGHSARGGTVVPGTLAGRFHPHGHLRVTPRPGGRS